MGQRKKMNGLHTQLDSLQVRGTVLGLDRHWNRYWLARPVCGTMEESLLLVELGGGIVGDLFDSNRPSDPEKEWVSIYFEADLHALLNSLETRGIREMALRAALLKHMPAVTAGMNRLNKLQESGTMRASNRKA